jgi:hypothetical protein
MSSAVVAGQGTAPGLLNSLEVRQLVSRSEPADHARLSAHFGALRARYAAEATRHEAMSRSFTGNPSRNLATGMSAHCRQLASLNTQAAATLRELAEYHGTLGAGVPAAAPRGGAPFQAGAGAPEPTEQELKALAAKASTPAEHRALEEYFRTLGRRYTVEGEEHAALAGTYRGTRLTQVAAHHDRLATLSRDAAKEAVAAAGMHSGLAGVAR